jgi:hypothetical protein
MGKYKFCLSYDESLAVKNGAIASVAKIYRKAFNEKYSINERFEHESEDAAKNFLESVDAEFKEGILISEWDYL